MPKKLAARSNPEHQLDKVSELCLALPATSRKDEGDHSTFLVAKKVFAYYLDDHHSDGIISVCCKVLPDDNQRLVQANPAKFYLPAHIGPRGWVGMRLDISRVDWAEVKEIVLGSYMQIAPAKILKLLQ